MVGGFLIGHWDWRWIFYINVPLAVLGFVATWLLVPRRGHRATETALDYVGIGLVTAGLFCLTLAIIQANEWGWTSLRDLGLLAVAVVTLTGFTCWELRVPSPMLELRLFRRRAFAAANVAVATVDIAMMGAAFLLVIFLVGVLDWTELRAAFAITPMPLAGLLLAPFVGRLVDRIGPRPLVILGALASAPAASTGSPRINLYTTAGDVAWRWRSSAPASASRCPRSWRPA